MRRFLQILAVLVANGCTTGAQPVPFAGPTTAEVLEKSTPADWRSPDPARTLYLQTATGRAVIELAPAFAPVHVANIVALAKAHFWDGTAIVRVQDNYVTQWGDPTEKKELGAIAKDPPAEYTRTVGADFSWTPLPDGDVYAPEVGHADGFPAGRDAVKGETWLLHCYGMVGVGRDMPPNTGTGAELYAVIGHAPRHLDRNLAVVGRVIWGMEHLTALPRGSEAMGFYRPEQQRPLQSVRLASEVPESERLKLEILRTDTAAWQAYVNGRRHRREGFFVASAGRVDVCNALPPVRVGK